MPRCLGYLPNFHADYTGALIREKRMKGEVLISAENVSKKFCKDLKRSLWYGAQDVVKTVAGAERSTTLRKDEFWAVQNINFEVRRGECLGLIGHNGAGKSTLLKMLNGLLRPDTGKITMRGRIGALIELGAGFNPILTGRENIFNSAAMLGFSKKETEEKLDSIIAFSEIEDFLDMPVQNYSSGMRVRLGFAVAAHMDPDILLIDEVLAVGDVGFVLKCYKRIDEILPNTAVIFVSHSMPMIARMSNQIMLMEKGKEDYYGYDINIGVNKYYMRFATLNDTSVMFSDGSIELLSAEVVNSEKENDHFFIHWNEDVTFRISLKVHTEILTPKIGLSVFTREQRGIATCEVANHMEKKLYKPGEIIETNFTIKKLSLSKDSYSITLTASHADTSSPMLRVGSIAQLLVVDARQTWAPFLLDAEAR